MAEEDEPYANIRSILGHFIGRTIIEITQHDEDDFLQTKQGFVVLMFDDGSTITIAIHDDKTLAYDDEPHIPE